MTVQRNFREEMPFLEIQPEEKRPKLLTFLCICTFIISGLNFLSYIMMPSLSQIGLTYTEMFPESMQSMYEEAFRTPANQYYMAALCCALSVIGAIFMFRMQKIGFHIYCGAKILHIALSLFIFDNILRGNALSIINTAIIIVLYALFYKNMGSKKDIDEINETENADE